MSRPVSHDVAWPVEPVPVGEIKALVEPVRCRGGEAGAHDPVEATCVETGVGYVVYECPDCGLRALYYHDRQGSDPCCGPRS